MAEPPSEFTARTGVPCPVNTSFNVAGEPIVCSPEDAVAYFLDTDIDHLVIGDFVVSKNWPPRHTIRIEAGRENQGA
ncbi:carbamoyltransferase C-terminal domain-containing protein, partial [Streptomyces anulatus]|uniref:carbamoyltransferase C-terminal domain-containing protein n=1 Tax=Streptomyces anulatus TaxID=1892 RepID=UPI003660EE3E